MLNELSSGQFTCDLNSVYEENVYWCKNLIKLPSGSAGKNFVKEITHLLKSWTIKIALRTIAWKCIMTIPQPLLQKPLRDSKGKDYLVALRQRLAT